MPSRYLEGVDTVLSYVVYSLSKAAIDNIITALDNEVCEEKLSEAKEILWKVSGDVVLGQFINPNRTNRTKRFANCTDIVDGLKKLDQENNFLLCVVLMVLVTSTDRIQKTLTSSR